MEKNTVVIVIPIHREEPTELEKISLQQTLAVLHNYPIVFQAPLVLETAWYINFCKGKADVSVVRFDWHGHEAYSVLHTSEMFYRQFLMYDYMLTCHLDAFVFRDELAYWCSLGYDYIGSIIYQTTFKINNTFIKKITTYNEPEYFGNGGFALRKIKTFYNITSRFKLYIRFYHWQRRLRKRGFYDDLFHCTHYPKIYSSYKIPPKQTAQKFGADFVIYNEADLPFTNSDQNSLPFGIHGWIKNQHEYWKPCIRYYGYPI